MVCPFYYIAETEMEMEEWQSERKHEAEKEPERRGDGFRHEGGEQKLKN